MQGRAEQITKTENRIMNSIKDYPKYVRDYYKEISDKSHNTRLMYMNRLCNFLNYLKEKGTDINTPESFRKLTKDDIKDFLADIKVMTDKDGNSRTMSNSYMTLQLSVLNSFFTFLTDREYIDISPSKTVKLEKCKEKKKVIYLTPEEVEQVMDNISYGVGSDNAKVKQENWMQRDMAIISLFLYSGLRVSALSEINMEDIDFTEHCIRVTEKENYTKDVYINEKTESLLKEWIERRAELMEGWKPNDALFISKNRTRITSVSINKLVKKYTYNIDKHITAHKFRATFATTMYRDTNDIYLVSDLLGHASVETTKRYAVVADDKKKRAIDGLSDVY